MAQKPPIKKVDLKELEEDFLQTLERVSSVFGDHAFQRWQPERDAWRTQVVASLFDAQMIRLRKYENVDLVEHSAAIVDGYKKLFVNEEFRTAVDAATNTPSYLKYRIRAIEELVRAILGA